MIEEKNYLIKNDLTMIDEKENNRNNRNNNNNNNNNEKKNNQFFDYNDMNCTYVFESDLFMNIESKEKEEIKKEKSSDDEEVDVKYKEYFMN